MSVVIRRANWPADREALRLLRTQVFVVEQGVPEALEWDGEDENCLHFLAETENGPVGCARLMPSGQIGRMAVLASERKNGLGSRLLVAAMDAAKREGISEPYLHAQVQVLPFYERHGFTAHGDRFMEAGIEHQSMRLTSEPTEGIDTLLSAGLNGRNLAPFEGEEAAATTAAELCAAAQRHIVIYSQLLDQEIFARECLVAALSEFVRGNARAHVDILIHSSAKIRARSHELVALAQRLSSKFTIRLVGEDERNEHRSFVVADGEGYWLLPDCQQATGIACAYDPVQAQHLAERFAELSRRAKRDPDLRTLRI
ncbi:MAG: GNAT family N-acetyltransferase [Pseudomonadaceae bacterium]|nr:GNAT family N-acetyltransferase [Pseudomonadaceae bacterium]